MEESKDEREGGRRGAAGSGGERRGAVKVSGDEMCALLAPAPKVSDDEMCALLAAALKVSGDEMCALLAAALKVSDDEMCALLAPALKVSGCPPRQHGKFQSTLTVRPLRGSGMLESKCLTKTGIPCKIPAATEGSRPESFGDAIQDALLASTGSSGQH
eukprot:gene17252-biopygen12356